MTVLRGLYAITDNRLTPDDTLLEQAEAALRGGVRILQYRDKLSSANSKLEQARSLGQICREHDALLIINDDVELARSSQAHGVHLGLDDGSITQAREYLGIQAIIGASCYNQIELAQQVHEAGASYVAFGRFFPSRTKPDAVQADLMLLQQARTIGLPVCAIGGITRQNAASVVDAGADMIAVVESIFGQPDVEQAAGELASLF